MSGKKSRKPESVVFQKPRETIFQGGEWSVGASCFCYGEH